MTQATVEPQAQVPVVSRDVFKQVEAGTISYAKFLEAVSPAVTREVVAPAKPSQALVLNDKQRAALDRLPLVYGSVVVPERRTLRPFEIALLLEERATLDELENLSGKRKESIRETVSIHLDVEAEASGAAEGKLYDKKGNLILEGKAVHPDGQRAFVRGVSNRTPSMDMGVVRAMELAGEIDHEAYLAVTRQERVFDENLFMLYLKKHPEMVAVFQKAVTPGSQYTALRIGKP